MTDTASSLIAKLLRDQPRNPTVIALNEAIQAQIAEMQAWKHSLYRHFDIHGQLLYIGISISAVNRLGQHKVNSHWFNAIQRIEVQKFKTREDAAAAEIIAIQTEHPLHNIQWKVEAIPAPAVTPATTVTTVTPVVTPKRDRAKYMRNYRAAQSSAGNNGRPKIQPPPV